MPDDIEIVRATITSLPPPTDEAGQPLETLTGPPPDQVDVAIEVRNTTSTTLFVWGTVSRFGYDNATRALTIHLADPGSLETPEFKPVVVHPQLPTQTAVLAGETATVHVAIPRVILRTRIVAERDTARIAIDPEPLGPVDQVQVRIAFADQPLQPAGDMRLESLQAQIRDWGRQTEAAIPTRWRPDELEDTANGAG